MRIYEILEVHTEIAKKNNYKLKNNKGLSNIC